MIKLSTEEVEEIFFSHIQNKTHLKVRRLGSLWIFFRHFVDLFKIKIKKNQPIDGATLIFCSDAVIDKQMFPGNIALKAKAAHIADGKGWDFEKYLLNIAFLLGKKQRHFIANYVINRVVKKIEGITFNGFICNFPSQVSYFIAIVLKRTNCKIFTYQHGIYLPDYYQASYFEKNLVNYNLVWGKVYKDCYLKSDIPADRILIVNSFIKPKEVIEKKIIPNPVFLGQQLYKVFPDVVKDYNKLLSSIIDIYESSNIKLCYKSHPREDINKSLTNENRARLKFLNKANIGEHFFEEFTHAYAVNSTSLVDALCSGLTCYQLQIDLGVPNIDYTKWTSILKYNSLLMRESMLAVGSTDYFIDPEFILVDIEARAKNSRIIFDKIYGNE